MKKRQLKTKKELQKEEFKFYLGAIIILAGWSCVLFMFFKSLRGGQ